MDVIRVKGKELEVNGNGFLARPDEWDADVATYIAAVEGIELTEHHWEVVNFLRDYYTQYKIAPTVKTLVKEIGTKLGPEKAKTRYLYELYPCGPAIQACKIAGLPDAAGCV